MSKRLITIAYRACPVFGFGLFGSTVLGGHAFVAVAFWAALGLVTGLLAYFATNEGADE